MFKKMMKKSTYLFKLIVVLALFSCDRSDDYQPGTGTEFTFATVYGQWTYFSFATGDIVGIGTANAATDELWRERTDWDLAFLINNVRTNSGTSGIGLGGARYAGTADFDSVNGAPLDGYTVDTDANIMYNMLPMVGPVRGDFPVNTAFIWTEEDGNNYVVDPKVFVVKTADGKYAKVFIKRMVTDPENRFGRILTMEYFYQPDGSRFLITEPAILID